MTQPHVKLNIFQAKAAIQKPCSPGTAVRMVTHQRGLRIPRLHWAHYTGQLNTGCRHTLCSAPTATHQFHRTSPHWPTSGGGSSWVAEKNLTDTLLVSFEGTLSTSLSSKGEVPVFKGRETFLGCGAAPWNGKGVCGFPFVCGAGWGKPPLSWSLAVHHPRENAGGSTSLLQKSSPPFTCCKEERHQLNRLFYNPSSLERKQNRPQFSITCVYNYFTSVVCIQTCFF